MNLEQSIREAVAAAFSGIWIRSHEHEDATQVISAIAQRFGWEVMTWDIVEGLQGGESERAPHAQDPSPAAALEALGAVGNGEGPVLLVMRNLHLFVATPEGRVLNAHLLQMIVNSVERGGAAGHHLLVLSQDGVRIPAEIEKHFHVIDHALPDSHEMWELARSVAEEDELPPADSPESRRLLDAAAGLTRLEALGAFSLSLARHKRIEPGPLWELKTRALRSGGLLDMHHGAAGFESVGGLAALKSFCLRAFGENAGDSSVRPRGVILVGVPGTGKSAFAKSLGREIGRPTVVMDIGALKGSLVGQTEANVRRALATIDALGPCVLFVDEIEKALAGGTHASNDGGVSVGLLGTLLTWLNDHESDVFFVGTSNDVTRLPPEFTRAERFDAVFFMDLPGRDQKDAIWELYELYFDLPADGRPDDALWTGAEIRACCRLAKLFGVTTSEAAKQVVPIALTSKEKVDALRAWAENRCLDADRTGIYRHRKPEESRPNNGLRRKISRN
jgi:hypothetical protein